MKNPTFSRFICYNSVFSSALNNFIFAFFACIFFIYTRFKDTHPAIVDEETWNVVQRLRETKRVRERIGGEPNPLTGVLYCADCGQKMYHKQGSTGRPDHPHHEYVCSSYRHYPLTVWIFAVAISPPKTGNRI